MAYETKQKVLKRWTQFAKPNYSEISSYLNQNGQGQ